MKEENLIALSITIFSAWVIGWGVAWGIAWVQSCISAAWYIIVGSSLVLLAILFFFVKYFSKREEKKHFAILLDELNHNKKKTEKEERDSYHFSAYDEAKKSKYLLHLSENLREKIYDAYDIIKSFRENPQNVHFQMKIPELEKLLEDIIPELEEYLKSGGIKK